MPEYGVTKSRYPNPTADNDPPADFQLLAQDLDRLTGGVADAAALTALGSSGTTFPGMQVTQRDTMVRYLRNAADSAWVAWNSDWISYASTLGAASGTFSIGTGGSALNRTEYKYVNGRVLIRYKFVLGSSGASMGTAPTFTAPFNLRQDVPKYQWLTGRGSLYDTSAAAAPTEASHRLNDTDANKVVIATYTGTVANITTTAPFTWAAGDTLAGEVWVDAA